MPINLLYLYERGGERLVGENLLYYGGWKFLGSGFPSFVLFTLSKLQKQNPGDICLMAYSFGRKLAFQEFSVNVFFDENQLWHAQIAGNTVLSCISLAIMLDLVPDQLPQKSNNGAMSFTSPWAYVSYCLHPLQR